jgi:TusA-related sulfurtransferase
VTNKQTEEKRVTVVFTDKSFYERIKDYAKEHTLSQGEVIEVLLDTVYDEHFLVEGLIQKRKAKVAGRTSIRSIIERTKGSLTKTTSQKAASK